MKDPITLTALGGSSVAALTAASIADAQVPLVGGLTVQLLFAVFAGACLAETFGAPRAVDPASGWQRFLAAAWALARVLGSTIVGALLAPAAVAALDGAIDGVRDHLLWGVLVGMLGLMLLRKVFNGIEGAADVWITAARDRIAAAIRGGK